MDKHGLYEFLTENYMDDLFNPEEYKACDYFDEDKFIGLKRDAANHLNILLLNIRSLPKHGGELVCLLEVLETKFDIIVLTEIGSRNISTVKHLLENYQLYYVIPKDKMFGGVGICVNEELTDVHAVDEFTIQKSCHCPKCEIENLFIKSRYHNSQNIVGGLYRHPNGKTAHFVNDLETSLHRIGDAVTTILAGDINIDLIKFENDDTMNYLITLLSNRYLPYITLPSRLTDFSATCIDHVFVKFTRQELVNAADVISGMFYFDMTDHLPCFLSIKSKYNPSNTAKPKVRLFGDRNCCKFREMMSTYDWSSLYICNNDWYSAFISVVKRLYLSCLFPSPANVPKTNHG